MRMHVAFVRACACVCVCVCLYMCQRWWPWVSFLGTFIKVRHDLLVAWNSPKSSRLAGQRAPRFTFLHPPNTAITREHHNTRLLFTYVLGINLRPSCSLEKHLIDWALSSRGPRWILKCNITEGLLEDGAGCPHTVRSEGQQWTQILPLGQQVEQISHIWILSLTSDTHTDQRNLI